MTETLHIYCRVSSANQEDNTSLIKQEEKGKQLADRLGFKTRVWNEGIASSSKDDLENRPVLVSLLGEITKGNVKHLYSEYQDRLSRNAKTWGAIRFSLRDNNVLYYSQGDTDPVDLSDPTDDLIFGVLSEIAQYDNRIREQRLSQGKFQRVAEGKWLGGPPPFGYKLSNHELVIDQFESEWVKQIYNSYLSGMSHREIQDLLRSNGVKTRRGNTEFSLGAIDKILTNTHYTGTYHVTRQKTGETWANNCPTIISKQVADKVKKLKESRSRKRGMATNTKYDYMLTDHLFCGYCNRKFRGRKTPRQNQFIYYCPAKHEAWRRGENSVDCEGVKSIKIQPTDDAVWQGIIDVISKSNIFKESIKTNVLGISSHQLDEKGIKATKRQVRELDKKITKYTESIGNLKADLIMEDNKSELISTINKLELDREKLQEQRDQAINSVNDSERGKRWVDWVAAFKDKIDCLQTIVSETERKQFLKEIVDKIYVNKVDDGINLDIHFTLPFVEDGLLYKDINDKKKGYEIVEGKSVYLIDYPVKKTV